RRAAPAHAVEEAVLALWPLAGARRCGGAEWWIGRAYTTDVPVEFHFDQDVKGRHRRHPRLSSVFFFNPVRGGQLAVTDQVPTSRTAMRLETVAPRRNRYAVFAGNLLHGVLDARGRTPGKRVQGPRGRLRVTLVVNYWGRGPSRAGEAFREAACAAGGVVCPAGRRGHRGCRRDRPLRGAAR